METVYTASTSLPIAVSALQVLSVVVTVASVPLLLVVLVWLVRRLAQSGR